MKAWRSILLVVFRHKTTKNFHGFDISESLKNIYIRDYFNLIFTDSVNSQNKTIFHSFSRLHFLFFFSFTLHFCNGKWKGFFLFSFPPFVSLFLTLNPKIQDHLWGAFVGGAGAGLAVDVFFFPLDTLKTRLQSSAGFVASGISFVFFSLDWFFSDEKFRWV